jgi:hypothetical protein
MTRRPVPAAELLAPPAVDALAAATECRARILEREGIAMFVALYDARPGRALRVRDPLSVAEGARLADLFDHYERALAAAPADPTFEQPATDALVPAEAAAVIDVLVVLSDQHLRARTRRPP